MANWKVFKITGKDTQENFIRFELDGQVENKSGSEWFIDCINAYPFAGHQNGDYIEINLEVTKNYVRDYTFSSTNIVRKAFVSTNVITVRGSSSDIVVSPSAVNYMKSQEARELAREMSRMVDDTGKEVEYKIQIENKDGKKISHSLILRKQ